MKQDKNFNDDSDKGPIEIYCVEDKDQWVELIEMDLEDLAEAQLIMRNSIEKDTCPENCWVVGRVAFQMDSGKIISNLINIIYKKGVCYLNGVFDDSRNFDLLNECFIKALIKIAAEDGLCAFHLT